MFLAFRVANSTGSQWSKLIADVTKSAYSHVELWIDGPRKAARCMSSREGEGVHYKIIDLTDEKAWTIVAVPTNEFQQDYTEGFCDGSEGKPYDYVDLIDAATGKGKQEVPFGRFCSGFCAEWYQKTFGVLNPQPFWTFSPGSLYEFMLMQGYKPLQ